MSDADDTLQDRLQNMLAEVMEGRQTHNEQTTTENIQSSTGGLRAVLAGVPNWMLNGIDVAFLLVGILLIVLFGTFATVIGVILAVIGWIGIIDAVWQRAKPYLKGDGNV